MGTRKTTHVKKKGKRKMTREQVNEMLAEAGIDTATAKAFVTNLLNLHNSEIKNVRIEAANKALDDFKEWHSPEEYAQLNEEFNAYKDNAAKSERKQKYTNSKIAEKWIDYVDEKLKNSEDFDKDLQAFVKANPELIVREAQPTGRVSFSNLGDSGSEGNASPNARMNAFIRGKSE